MSEYGEFVVTRFLTEGGERLRIDRADARIRIASELLDELARNGHPDIALTESAVRIAAVNRTVKYRLGESATDEQGFLWRHAELVEDVVPS